MIREIAKAKKLLWGRKKNEFESPISMPVNKLVINQR